MRLVIALIIFAFATSVRSQNEILDSLHTRLEEPAISDSLRGYLLDELSYEWFYNSLDSSLFYAKKSLKVFERIDLSVGQSRALTSTAVAFHYKHDWDSAQHYYERALELNQIIGDDKKAAGTLNNLGVLQMDKGDLEGAAQRFLSSLEIKESLNDSLGILSGNTNLGLIFRKQGNYEKAIEYYDKALQLGEDLNATSKLPTIYLNVGSLYNYKMDFETGLKYNLKGLKVSKELQASRYLGESYVNLSDSYLGLGKSDSSLFYIDQAVEMFRENADTVNLSRALNSAAALHLNQKNYRLAIRNSLEVEKLNDEKNLELKVKNDFNLALAYAGLGNSGRAYEALLEAYGSKDSLLNESLNESISELTTKYESEKKERTIIELELNKKETALDISKANNQRNVFILIAVLVLGVSILLFFLLRLKSQSNATIAKSLEEKETLLKEIHHRVKNNLQVVSSLLSMQSRFITDENALGAVNEGQARVESMALIHQKLYQEHNLSGVNVREYIQELADMLKDSYSTGTDVEFEYDVDDLIIDVDTIIPIGLILNELICNSLKHAFPEEHEGKIHIALSEEDERLKLEVSDNGVGQTSEPSGQSFGTVLIDSLAQKLKATLEMKTKAGTTITLSISKYKLL